MKQPSFHVLAMPFPAQGHISPLLHLSKALAAQGFTVTFLNVDSIHKLMVQNWVPTEGLDIRLASIDFTWNVPKGFDAYCMANLPQFFDAVPDELGAKLEKFIAKISQDVAPVLAIISDYFLPWTQFVADKCGIPRVLFWSGTAAWTTVEYHFPELFARGQVPPSESELSSQEKLIDWIPGLTPLRPADLPVYMHVNDKRWVQISLERSPVVEKAWKVLVNSFYELEPDTFDVMYKLIGGSDKFFPAGPILLQQIPEHHTQIESVNVVLRAEDKQCLHWLDTQKESSVLYISFGSVAVLESVQFGYLANALENSKQPFLWVIRSELVVGSGHEELYEGFCERTKDQGYITSWAPQLRVLEHSSVGGFITHCGWNSMLEGICNGVPLIGWPWAAEQNLNCKLLVEDWKIGARLSKGESGLYEQDEIERVIKLLMDEGDERKAMKANVKKIQKQAHAAVADGNLSARNLKAFYKDLKSLARV